MPGYSNRREWIARIIATTGAVSLLPSLTEAQGSLQFFSPQQISTLEALGERILPGSANAHCAQFVDVVLAIDSQKNQRDMTTALEAFDAAAQSGHGRPFAHLQPEEQDHLLSVASTGDNALHGHFDLVKEWIADTYWSSEQGLKDLGWDGRMAWTSFSSACEKPIS